MTGRERCLAAIAGRPTDRVPVFPLLMFLPAARLGISYREYATNGQAMAEAQLNARRLFGLDAITACSDAFRISADLGGDMVFPENGVPHLRSPLIAGPADLARLTRPDPSDRHTRMADRVRAVEAMARAAGEECLTVGWVDMPFAEACSACGVTELMFLLSDEPAQAHRILEFLTGIVIDFAIAQLEAGAPMIGAGDAAASLVSPEMYREFALPCEVRVFDAIHAHGGLGKLHICGNTTALLADIARSGADLVNVDHLVDFTLACRVYGAAGVCFKGNLDPVADMLHATPAECERTALDRIDRASGLRYMLSPGCEVPAGVSDEVLRAFCKAPRSAPLRHPPPV
jgi:MtaA/CmuA family methyltransferase